LVELCEQEIHATIQANACTMILSGTSGFSIHKIGRIKEISTQKKKVTKRRGFLVLI